MVKLSIFELKQLFTLTFSHDAKKYVLKLRTQLVFLRKRRHCLVPVFLGFSRRKKRFLSSYLNQSKITRDTMCSWTCFEEHGVLFTRKPNFSSPADNYFHKKALTQIFNRVLNMPLNIPCDTAYDFNLTLSWRTSLSYRNQFIDLLYKSMNWFLYDRDLRHERVNLHNLMKLWKL